MRIAPRYRGVLVGVAASVVLGSAAWLGCARNSAGGPVLNRACAEPPTTLKALKNCTDGLHFADEELQGDRQRLMVSNHRGLPCPASDTSNNCRLGPLGRIQPEDSSNQGTDRDLEQRGRIIALLTLDESAREDYPKLAMFRGHKTYWWVKKGTGDSNGISMYVSDSVKSDGTLYYVRKDSLKIYGGRAGAFKHALARWIWVPDDETTKGTCSSSSSCK